MKGIPDVGLVKGAEPPKPLSAAGTEAKRVAKEFEAIFLRKMLAGMEKTTSLTGHSAGAGMYGQMVTDALADAMGSGGGIGLATELEKYMAGPGSSTTSSAGENKSTAPLKSAPDGPSMDHERQDAGLKPASSSPGVDK